VNGRQSSVAGQPATSDRTPPGWDEAVRLDEDPATVPDPASVEVPVELRAEIERHVANYPDRHSAALPALAAAQRVHGWCSPEAITQVAAVMQVTPAYLSSVATFYDMLRTRPAGSRYVYVCTSVACHLRDAKSVFDAIEAQAAELGLEDFEIREFECLGACDMAPMASLDGRYVGPLTEADAPELVAALKDGREPLPGRGLADPGFELRPVERPTPPAEPDVHPAGGTWKDAVVLDVPPAEGPPPRERPTLHPLDPGTSEVPELRPEEEQQ
jgi:NADH-quinone oxidoreductase subunit E